MYYVAHTGAVRRTGWYERFWAWLIAQASPGSITRSQDESEVSWLTTFRWQGSDWQGRLCSPGAQRVCLASICGWIQPGWVLGHDTVSLITQYGYTAAAQWRSTRPIGLQLTPFTLPILLHSSSCSSMYSSCMMSISYTYLIAAPCVALNPLNQLYICLTV